jgi:protein-tyrosine phosphatase
VSGEAVAIELNLVDIHSHVLWGVDDGAQTLEDSLAMVAIAAAAGTTDLVATPHASPRYKYDPELVRERLADIQAAAEGTLRLYAGCDFHLSYDNIQDALANPRKYTINGNRYLLVEFSELLIFRNTADIFSRLLDADMVPIVTHPERNPLLCQRIEELAAWCEAGAYLQVTGQSLLGRFGKRAAEFSHTLIEHGLVHFVASDGHDTVRRPPRLDDACTWLEQRYGREVAQALCEDNPRAALTGEPVSRPAMKPSPSARKWYQIWR